MSTDLALEVTARLRDLGVSGSFVEFFGSGVSRLRVEDRAVVANMAPEYGASTGYFPVDAQTLSYLRRTGRREERVAAIEPMFRSQALWFEPESLPDYDRSIQIDLASLSPTIAGPRRPQDRRAPHEAKSAIEATLKRPLRPAETDSVPDAVNAAEMKENGTMGERPPARSIGGKSQ